MDKNEKLKQEIAQIADDLEAAAGRVRALAAMLHKTGWSNSASAENGKKGGRPRKKPATPAE